MAEFSFNVSVVGRNPKNGKPGNAVASAAYISRERLTDEHTGAVYDYRSKGGIEFSAIYTPANAPEWMKDRERLWNEVEQREDESSRADNAQVARRIIAAIPHELDAEKRLWLVKDFVREMTRKGMVVDFAIHDPDAHGDQRNYHVHMLLTMREVTPNGFGYKVREWNKDENVRQWRDRWAELGAKALERAGNKLEADRYRVSHGTLDAQRQSAIKRGDLEHAQKLDRRPTRHMGPRASAMERERGEITEKGEMNRSIKLGNARRALGKTIALGESARDNAKTIASVPKRMAGKALEGVIKGIDSLFNPVLTPERRMDAEQSVDDRMHAAQTADRQRQDERDRDR